MGIWRRLSHALAVFKGRDPRAVHRDQAEIMGIFQPPTAPPVDAIPLAETEQTNPTIGRAVDVISRDAASVPLLLTRRTGPNKHDIVEQHPAIDVFRWINQVDTPNLYWQQVYADLLTFGDHFTWVDLDGDTPVNLLRMPSAAVKPVPHPRDIVAGYVWEDHRGNQERYTAREVLHYKTRNPDSIYRGMSLLERLRHTVLLEREMRRWNYNRFKNGIPATLIMKTTRQFADEEELRQFKDYVRNTMAGSGRAGDPIVAHADEWDIEPLERPSEDEIAFLNGLKFNRAEIATVFGVPPSELMDFSDAFRANAKEQTRTYWEATIMSWHRLILEYLNTVYLPRFWPAENALEFRYDYAQVKALGFSQFEMAQVNEILVRSGIRTPNEARHAMGDDRFDDEVADQLYYSGRSWGSNPLANIPGIGEAPDDDPDEFIDDQGGGKSKIVPFRKQDPPNDHMDPAREKELLRAKFERILAEVVRVAGEQQLDVDGIAGVFDIANPDVIRFIENQAILVSGPVIDTTVERIRTVIAEGLAEGTPVPQLREKIQEAFRARRLDHELDRIARTEVHQAQEGGGYHAARQHGVEFKKWVSSRDSRVRGDEKNPRADHRGLEGQVVPIDARFEDPVSQALLLYPGDAAGQRSGADVINCRCTWVSVWPDEDGGQRFTDLEHAWYTKDQTRQVFEQAIRALVRSHLVEMEKRVLASLAERAEAV